MSGFCLHTPAKSWTEGALCGNGTLGAVIMGSPAREQVILNREDLFAPLYGTEKPIPMAEKLPEIRSLIREGRYKDAGHIPWKMFLEKYPEKLWTNPFIPAGDLLIETRGISEYRDYSRSLDFETGEAVVSFRSNGIRYRRKILASRAHGKLFAELSAKSGTGEKQPVTEYKICLEKHPHEKVNPFFPYDGLYDFLRGRMEIHENSIDYICHYGERTDGYRIRMDIPKQDGAECFAEEDGLKVRASKPVLLAISIELLEHCEPDTMTGGYDYERIFCEAAPFHRGRMSSVQLALDEEKTYESDEELYQAARETKADAAFLNRIFDAGRYAILSSTGKLPPNLQGIWNALYHVPWSSDYTQDGNLQTAILGMLPCGDFEGMQSFFRYQESLMDDYRENSRILYGCRGIHVPTRTSDRGYDIHFDETWPMLFWTAGAGWNARFFYDYWLFTGDNEFFKEHALPFMKEAALFYEDYLIEDENGKWLFTPGYSPENTPKGNDSSTAMNATMDLSVAKELFANLITGCRTLGLTDEEENIRKWEWMLSKLPPYQMNQEGALKEWASDLLEDEYDHRHISHLYLLYYDIPEEVRADRKLYEACRKAYEIKMERKKKEQGTMAFGLIQAGMVAAHLKDSEMTEILLQSLAKNDYYPTFASAHDYGPNIFNVDISGGLPAMMLECIAQSIPVLRKDLIIDHYEIRLLPALPESMRSGKVDGLRLRGGFQMSLRWRDGKLLDYSLKNILNNRYVIV